MCLVELIKYTDDVCKIKEQLFAELYSEFPSIYDDNEAGTRMGQLICLLQDFDVSFYNKATFTRYCVNI